MNVLNMMKKLVFIVGVICLTSSFALSAEKDFRQEKASFVYNFIKHISYEFPDEKKTLFLCFIGSNDNFLKQISGRRVHGVVIKSQNSCSRDRSSSIDVFYLDKSSGAAANAIAKLDLMSISDARGFAKKGGVFEFVVVDGKLRFIINNTKAKSLGYTISSKLLSLAIKVY